MKKIPTWLKDGLIGLGIGSAIIVPGISGGTIALIFGAFKKIVVAVSNLFKQFWKNLLILLPFGIGAVLAIAGLYVPFKLAFEHCLFAIVCLFGGFILGSIPGITDNVKGQKPTKVNILLLVVGLLFAVIIGVTSVLFNFDNAISKLFMERQWYLFLILFAVGLISSSGLIVPGFSGSLILLVIGFYIPIFTLPSNIVHGEEVLTSILLLLVFAIGVAVGFVLFSKLMNYVLEKHRISTHYTIIGFIGGSLVSIFINSNMFNYYKNPDRLFPNDYILDWILGPIFFVVAVIISYLFVRMVRKMNKKEELENAENTSSIQAD